MTLHNPRLGDGSCDVGYYLGPDLANVGYLTLEGAGTGIEVQVYARGCTSTNGVPSDIGATAQGTDPIGGTCSKFAQLGVGVSPGDVGADASCGLKGWEGYYHASQTLTLDNLPNDVLQMSNSVPGCSNASFGVSCSWSLWYYNHTA